MQGILGARPLARTCLLCWGHLADESDGEGRGVCEDRLEVLRRSTQRVGPGCGMMVEGKSLVKPVRANTTTPSPDRLPSKQPRIWQSDWSARVGEGPAFIGIQQSRVLTAQHNVERGR